MLNASPIVSSPARPANLASAAAAVLNGADPLTVSDIPSEHPALGPAVRELAEMLGEPVPAAYALPAPEGVEDLIALDPREQFPYSAHEAEDHYQWACENGTDFDDHDNLPDSDPNDNDDDMGIDPMEYDDETGGSDEE